MIAIRYANSDVFESFTVRLAPEAMCLRMATHLLSMGEIAGT
jgi:hypothetical protein